MRDGRPASAALLLLVVVSAVAGDWIGLWTLPVGEMEEQDSMASRLPEEYLYLDDERVRAYLGQLREGLSEIQQRTLTTGSEQEVTLGKPEVVQVGDKRTRSRTITETVAPTASERFYQLEGELERHFADAEHENTFLAQEAGAASCADITDGDPLEEGQVVRISGARLQAPTFVLPLARLAHATQWRSKQQRDKSVDVKREELAELARRHAGALDRYVASFDKDPRVPLRLTFAAGKDATADCQVLVPIRYLALSDAPSLLTGQVTIVGKVVRRPASAKEYYYDVESAVTYGKVVDAADPAVREALGLYGGLGANAVGEASKVRYPGLVLLPIAIYK